MGMKKQQHGRAALLTFRSTGGLTAFHDPELARAHAEALRPAPVAASGMSTELGMVAAMLLELSATLTVIMGQDTLAQGVQAYRDAGSRVPSALERSLRHLDAAAGFLRHPHTAKAVVEEARKFVAKRAVNASFVPQTPAAADVEVVGPAPQKPRRRRNRKNKKNVDMAGTAGDTPVMELEDDSWAMDVGDDTAPLSSLLTVAPKPTPRASSTTRVLVPSISDEARQPPLKKSPSSAAATADAVLGLVHSSPIAHADTPLFRVGAKVVIGSLQARPELSGQVAMVISFDPVAMRYAVRIPTTSEQLRIRAENLKPSLFG